MVYTYYKQFVSYKMYKIMIKLPHLFPEFIPNIFVNKNAIFSDSCPIEIDIAYEYCDITLYDLMAKHGFQTIQEVSYFLQFDLQSHIITMIDELTKENIDLTELNTMCILINMFPYLSIHHSKKVKFICLDLYLHLK